MWTPVLQTLVEEPAPVALQRVGAARAVGEYDAQQERFAVEGAGEAGGMGAGVGPREGRAPLVRERARHVEAPAGREAQRGRGAAYDD